MTVTRVPAARVVIPPLARAEILKKVEDILDSGVLTLGPHTLEFETDFAQRHRSRHAIAVSSGSAALEIILRSLGAGGQTIVVPTNTFFATAAAVVHAGGTPRFADVSADTLAMTAATVEAALSPETRGVIFVHIGGLVTSDIADVAELCRDRGLFLVEDAAHAHGSSWAGQPAGTFGEAAAFSFYPTKVITSGEGGMIVTARDDIRDDARIHRDQGKGAFETNDHVRMGSAWRMSEVHAAIGSVLLGHLDEFIGVRANAAAIYDAELRDLGGWAALHAPPESVPNHYKYTALLPRGIARAEFKRRLGTDLGVSLSGEVYATPLHRQPVFAEVSQGEFPVADDVCLRHVCLPIHSDMSEAEARQVAAAVREVYLDMRGER